MLLSSRPLMGGRSPAERLESSRTWLTREVVHAENFAGQPGLFCDFEVGAMRVLARLKSTRAGGHGGAALVRELCEGQAAADMLQALEATGRGGRLYRNMLTRLVRANGLENDERAEVAMVLFVAAGCTGDARTAVADALRFSHSVHGGRMEMGDAEVAEDSNGVCLVSHDDSPPLLGLLRMVGDYIAGGPYWVSPERDGATIGMLALGSEDIVDVEPDVANHHARVWFDGSSWFVEDLRSGSDVAVFRDDNTCHEVAFGGIAHLSRGDEIVLGRGTRFHVVFGLPGVDRPAPL
ncbi:MAG: FHA domain-containing protein [Eggerthellaceae bacterium]|nr:FHA domain-containing protein [Eggerthellaceae bacterium]